MSQRSSSVEHHHSLANRQESVPIAVITVSDTRTAETDENAQYLKEKITQASHKMAAYLLVKDEPKQVEEALKKCVSSEARIILFNGGTGISKRDRTYDVLSRKLEKILPGFGELFRQLSYQDVGPAAMLSRAIAGVYKNKIIISVPGSPDAVRLAWTKLIAPEINHLAWECTR